MKQWFAVAALTCGLGVFAAAAFAADAEKAAKSDKAAGKTFTGIRPCASTVNPRRASWDPGAGERRASRKKDLSSGR